MDFFFFLRRAYILNFLSHSFPKKIHMSFNLRISENKYKELDTSLILLIVGQ